MSRRPTTYKVMSDGDIGVWTTYEDRQPIKDLPGAHWDPSLRCWRVPYEFQREVDDVVRRINGGTRDDVVVGALRELFSVLPSELRKPTQRALSRAWHPDTGGDHGVMLALNAVWDSIS